MTRPAWSWADYEREKRIEERRAAKRAAPSQETGEVPTADSTRGREGRVAEVLKRSPEANDKPLKTRQACVEYEPRDKRAAYHAELNDRVRSAPRGAYAAPTPHAKIDISAAPSGMEAFAERWRGKGLEPIQPRKLREVPEGHALCRCGARDNTKARGPVPAWFGAKCIEANCELRASSSAAVGAKETRGPSCA